MRWVRGISPAQRLRRRAGSARALLARPPRMAAVMLALVGIVPLFAVPALGVTSAGVSAAARSSDWAGSGFCATQYDQPYLGTSYDGVAACGQPYKNSNSNTQGEISYKGVVFDYVGFQCVELANRFIYYVDQIVPVNGDSLTGGNYVSTVHSTHRSISVGSSPGTSLPVAGDIISMWGGSSGSTSPNDALTHVAVVTGVSVSGSGWTIHVMEENASASGSNSISVSSSGASWSYNDGYYTSFKWLNLKNQSPGGTWGTAEEVPGIGALNTGGHAWVVSISCASPGNCSAGGLYQTDGGDQWAFVVSEVNGTWGKAQKVVGASNGITSVSCASAGNCSAVGYSNNQQAFVVSQVNGTWGKAIGVPGAAASEISQSWLYSVSCGSPGNCSAGGMYQTDDGSANEAFVVTQSGGTWGRLIEVPGTAALNTSGYAEVTSVSCRSADNCSAGGSYLDADGTQAFVVSETDGAWGKAIEVPGTAALNTSGYAVVTSVSCASAGNCSGGGLYSTGSAQDVFVVGQVNGTWHTAIELPGGIGGAASLTSVSCASPGNCAAGGYYGGADGTQAFVASETDGTWGTATNVPGTGGTGDEVTTISCASAGNCSAGGGSTGDQAFVVSETDGTWGTATVVRGLGTGGSELSSVSCAAAGNCSAGGTYTDSSGNGQAFVVSETAQ
jgi:hypothetical protein